jgi:hypothetical protein
MPNPWFILGGVLLVLALVAGAGVKGHSMGVDAQKAMDQAQFDAINAALTKQKSEANALLQKAQGDIIALQQQRDSFKTQLEVKDAQNRNATAALTAKYSGLQLRFRTAQSAGCGAGSASAVSSPANAASDAGTAIAVLPDAVTASLRQLAIDADNLNDAYKLCYGYATKVK